MTTDANVDCDGYGPISRTNHTSAALKTNELYVKRRVAEMRKCRKCEKQHKKRNIFRKTFYFLKNLKTNRPPRRRGEGTGLDALRNRRERSGGL